MQKSKPIFIGVYTMHSSHQSATQLCLIINIVKGEHDFLFAAIYHITHVLAKCPKATIFML